MFIELDGDTDADGDYEISWESSLRASSYILQEGRDPSFTSPRTVSLCNMSETKTLIYGKSDGDYYYRVRVRNIAGESEWSPNKKITVSHIIWEIGYNDDSYEEFDPLPVYPGRFPWHYYVGDYRFPKEINDGARTPINIHYSLTDEQSKNDLLLTLDIHSVNRDYLDVHIKTQINECGTLTFNNVEKVQEIEIRRDIVTKGENIITLENASSPYSDRWLFCDCLSLKVK